MADYRLSPTAQRDLNGIFDYTAKDWGLEQAVQHIGIIRASCARLAAIPLSGLQCENLRRGYRFIAVGQHRIYFKPRPMASPLSASCTSAWKFCGIYDGGASHRPGARRYQR